ncbi:unnamed protein product [Rhizophagus irregularis]|nr:unnamed protein product [Rhizophagus irregularis]
MFGKELSETLRERIIGSYLSGIKQCIISEELGVPKSTVNDTIKRYKKTGSATPEKRPVRKYLHNEGLGNYTAQKKPLLIRKQRKNRLRWSKDKKNWQEEWKQVVWSDESRFALFESDGRVRVWRRAGDAYNKDCIQPTVKFGGGSVMFWGCFGWHGVRPLVVVSNYPNSIFQQDGASCHTSSYTV